MRIAHLKFDRGTVDILDKTSYYRLCLRGQSFLLNSRITTL